MTINFQYNNIRRDYIELLNHNTLSLDGMATLNAKLRELIHDENWKKHQHVQWIVNMANEIAKNLVSTMRGIWTANEDEKIMDKLIESLIGDPDNGQWDRNFLTHFNLALLGLDDNADGARPGGVMPNAVVPALNARTARLRRNFNALLLALRTHVHPVPAAPGTTLVAPIAVVLERSLLSRNGTDEDDNFSRTWINETLKESNLTEDQVNLKHFILSDQELTSRVFGPVIMEELERINKGENDSGRIFNCMWTLTITFLQFYNSRVSQAQECSSDKRRKHESFRSHSSSF